ncbi:MAG: SMI1/KNR4 family protein [Salibacteraceae bacterium]
MKEILTLLFKKSIEFGDETYTEEQLKMQWIGNPPASTSQIESAEKRLGVSLPKDYIDMVSIANGFPTSSSSVEPSFHKVEEIDFYRNIPWNVIDTWKQMGELDDVVAELEKAIIVAGLEEEQQFLIIPPEHTRDPWKYWKFAMWIPGEEPYNNLKEYFSAVIEVINDELH